MVRKIVDETGAEVMPARAGDPVELDLVAVTEAAEVMLADVPDAPDDDGAAIYARLLNAEDWESLNQEAKLPNGREVTRRLLSVRALVKRASDIESDEEPRGMRLSHYLVIDSVDTNTGELVRWQTSSGSLVLPLVKLYRWGKLPAVVEVRESEKKTRRGFKPLNLTVHAVS